jgi:hypothetical protein
MKQTAVEWLVSILNKEGFAPVLTEEEIKQAKEMEKEQILDTYCDVKYYGFVSAEQYYNETFNK